MKYIVELESNQREEYEIEADSYEEAEEKAFEMCTLEDPSICYINEFDS